MGSPFGGFVVTGAVINSVISLAQAAPSGGPGGQSTIWSFVPFILIFGVFYLLVIRPQQKKSRLHQDMLTQLRAGDVVVTQGGIIGKISGIKDQEIVVEVQQGVRLKVLRSHITTKYTPGGETPKADAKAS
jgi:preprotein translocase subunit YajC